jgi:hypothetical protein
MAVRGGPNPRGLRTGILDTSLPQFRPGRNRVDPLILFAYQRGMTTAAPKDPRRDFMDVLEAAKRSPNLKETAKSTTKDGPNKLLASQLRISPGRVGELLDPSFFLGKGASLKEYSPARLRKTLGGFAGSVERAVAWLRKTQVDERVRSLDTMAVIDGYWPKRKALAPEFADLTVQQAIKEGINSAQETAEKTSKINIELWIPNWGPLAQGEAEPKTAFYSEYGNAILLGIDPVDGRVEPRPKSLSEALALPARTLHSPWVVALGPYEALHRRFRGQNSVTFPLQFPLVGLIACTRPLKDEDKNLEFKSILSPDFHFYRVVVSHDVGHYVLYSMTQDSKRIYTKVLDTEKLEDVPQLFMKEVEKGEPIVFLADGMLTFEVFVHLLERGCHVEIIHQDPLEPEFAFQSGIMFREEDQRFADLLVSSQRQLFKSCWRVENLFMTFIEAVLGWLRGLRLTDNARKVWADSAPIFLLRTEHVARWTEHANAADKIVQAVGGRISTVSRDRNGWIGDLFKVSPKMK